MQKNPFESFTKNNLYIEYLVEFEKEISTNSDRGIVLVCGSVIDSLLNELLKSFLINSDRVEKEVVNNNGILGTFDSKIKMSYYLGLISLEEKRILEILQKVRNKFAHQVLNISFADNTVSSICSNFIIPKNGFLPNYIPFETSETEGLPKVDLNPIKKKSPPKERFIIAFKYLFIILGDRINYRRFTQRKEFEAVITADTLIEHQIESYQRVISKIRELIKDTKEKIDEYSSLIKELKEKKKRVQGLDSDKIETELKNALEIKNEYNDNLQQAYTQFQIYIDLSDKIMPIQEYSLKVIRNSME